MNEKMPSGVQQKRLTKEEINDAAILAGPNSTVHMNVLLIELNSARASEAEKDKALQEKDATIKALADALMIVKKSGVRLWFVDEATCKTVDVQREVANALTLVGRLP